MEYLPLGNLAEQHRISRISEWETVTLLCQGLDALSCLHSRKIVHRDLKPENILVQCRERAKFCVKIADFELARDGSFLETFCGTQLYAAPEIMQKRTYTAKVDIWLLGVIAFQFVYGLPEFPIISGIPSSERWSSKLIREIRDWDRDELLDFLSSSMLKMDPDERLPAPECLKGANRLCEKTTPASELEPIPGTPTETMSSSTMSKALRAAGHEGQQMGAEVAAPLSDFPTLSTIKSYSRPRKIITQVWGYALDDDYKLQEDEPSQEQVESGVESVSQASLSKRKRIEQPGDELLLNQQIPWKQYEDQILIENSAIDCIQMVIEGKPVSMRKSDCWLNATQLITLAGKTKKERDCIMAILKQHNKVEVSKLGGRPQSWITYQDGRHLCLHLQLANTLLPLLNYGLARGTKLDNTPNIFEPEFLGIRIGQIAVFIRRKDLWINATHILKAGGKARVREIPRIRARGEYDHIHAGAAAGTYVHPSTGLQLCEEYGLNELKDHFKEALEKHGYQRETGQSARIKIRSLASDSSQIRQASREDLPTALPHESLANIRLCQSSKAPSYITEWQGTPNLQPFKRSEVLEGLPAI